MTTRANTPGMTSPIRSQSSLMESTMGARGGEVPSRTDGSGKLDPRRRDVLHLAAGAAHADVDPDDRVAAQRRGGTRRKWTYARAQGPRALRDFQTYLLESPEPFRLEAHIKSLVKQMAIRKLSRADLIARFHELRGREKQLEGADNGNDVRAGLSWLDRAAQKERDAAVEEELAAVMREFAARGITEAEVFGR